MQLGDGIYIGESQDGGTCREDDTKEVTPSTDIDRPRHLGQTED